MSGALVLHGYWRSGTSNRTRIALEIQGVAYEQVPQFYAAQRYSVDCSGYPRLLESVRNAMAEEPVRRAHPDYQPDADPA